MTYILNGANKTVLNTMGSSAVICLVICLESVVHVTSLNERPILGVLAQASDPDRKQLGDTYIPANYIKYIESAGARVVPVRIRESEDYYQKIFKSINGILFPGGMVSLINSSFAEEGKWFYNMAIQAYDEGDYFPVWGTCQGFELLATITAKQRVMSNFSAEDLALPLDFTKDFKKSRLFGNLPEDVYRALLKKNVTENFHMYGLSPEDYAKNPNLRSFYKVLSTNKDRNGKEFVSTIEANRYPIYGTQWHPEKTMFTWDLRLHVQHDTAAVRVSQHFANFLVAEARKSSHHFASLQEEMDALIYNYNPVFFSDGSFIQNYYFNFTDNY